MGQQTVPPAHAKVSGASASVQRETTPLQRRQGTSGNATLVTLARRLQGEKERKQGGYYQHITQLDEKKKGVRKKYPKSVMTWREKEDVYT